jgi:hypothetical protein
MILTIFNTFELSDLFYFWLYLIIVSLTHLTIVISANSDAIQFFEYFCF